MTQEETNTRLLLYALMQQTLGQKLLSSKCKTHVIILSLAFNKKNTLLAIFEDGLEEQVKAIVKDICTALVWLHAFTGYNTINAFTGRGKLLGEDKMYLLLESILRTCPDLGSFIASL